MGVLLGKGDGTFQPQQTFGTGNVPLSLAVGDFNGDGLPDLATANEGTNTVSVLLNSLTESASATLNNVSVTGTGTHQVAASYGGDSYHQPSNSGGIALTATQITTSLSLTANQSTITAARVRQLDACDPKHPNCDSSWGTITTCEGQQQSGTCYTMAADPVLVGEDLERDRK